MPEFTGNYTQIDDLNIWLYTCRKGLQEASCGSHRTNKKSRGHAHNRKGCASCAWHRAANWRTAAADAEHFGTE